MARHLSSTHPVHLHLARRVSASRRGRRPALRQLVLSCLLTFLVLAGVLSQWSLLVKSVSAATGTPVRSTPPSLTFAKYLKEGPHSTSPHSGPPSPYPQPPKHAKPGQPLTASPSAEPATMPPINQVLSPAFLHGGKGTTALDLHGSDGRLELILQPGSLDLSHANIAGGKAPQGALTLQLRQAYGHFESLLNLLGSYSAQIVDSKGNVVHGITLTTPATLLYHYQPGEFEALNLDAKSILLSWPSLIAAARQAHQPTADLTVLMQNDPQAHELSAQSVVLGPGPFSLGGDPQNQMAPIPHEAEVQGNNGQLSYSYPLQVAPGSGGFAPQLTLTYSSIGPNDRHNATSPADDAGDGWALGLGSITADVYPNGTTWYFLNGIDNVGDRMLLYDSTNKLYYTEHLSYLRIQQVSANGQPCFDVWDKSGTFYELGCTTDSLEYSINNGQRDNYAWYVDRIVAPNEGPGQSYYKMIQVSYLQDCSGSAPPCGASTTVRDAVIEQITYGLSQTLRWNSFTSVAGTIDFTYRAPFDDAPWATHYGTNYNCNGSPPISTTLRCDDPVQYTGSNPFNPPTVMGTFSLTGITSYLNTDGSSSNAAYAYNFSYTDTPFQFCTDPVSLEHGYCAGEHVLTQIQPLVFQSGTPHPLQGITFSYSPAPGQSGVLTNTYYDPSHNNYNNQPISSSTSWQYLTAYQDLDTGIGEQISYAPAYNNSDGTPTYIVNGQVKDDRYDALYCYNNRNNQSQYQCTGHYAHPDDRAWSTQVVTQITSSGQDSSALAPATTRFNYYRLAYTNAQWDGQGPLCYEDQYGQEKDCVGDNWLSSVNEGDEDWGDYFHAEFRGFAQVWQLSPSSDLSIGYYFSTLGWNSSMTNPNNYNAGQLQRSEVYQQATYQSSSLLSQTINTYPTTSNACVSGPPSSWNPYDACTIALLTSTTTEFDGNSTSNAPWVEHDYTYDDYNNGLNTNNTYHNLTKEVIKGSNLPSAPPNQLYPLTETWSYTVNNNNGQGGWTYYTVDTVTHSESDDAAGNKWLCQSTTYDEHPGNNNPTPAAGWPTTVQADTGSNCSNPVTSYTDYDIYGNIVATVDPFAAATPSLYQNEGCTPTSAIAVASSGWTMGRYTTCTNYDDPHYQALPVSSVNAFTQTTSYSYDPNQGNILQSSTDPNNQTTSYSYSYDSQGNRTVQVTAPDDQNAHYTSQTNTYSSCPGNNGLPCYAVESLSHLYSTVHTTTFYDSEGRAVETITPGPAPTPPQQGNPVYYTVVFTSYNDAQHSVFQSNPFVIAITNPPAHLSYIDPNGALDYTGKAPGGTATYYDALGRPIAVQDPLLGSPQEKGIACSSLSQYSGVNFTACTNYTYGQLPPGMNGDQTYYSTVTAIDSDQHVSVSYLDALGRTVYTLQDSGTYGNNPTANALTTIQYNVLDEPTSVQVQDLVPQSGETTTSVTTTAQYDSLGRLTQVADPDRGTHSYSIDADGRVYADASGSGHTIGYVYDLLGRIGCVQDSLPAFSPTGICNSGGNPYVQNTYDQSFLGNPGTTDFPVGRLTKSVTTTYYPDSGSPSVSVTQLYQHDQRGRLTQENLSISLPAPWKTVGFTALPTYILQPSYNDADQVTTTTTSTNPSGQGYTSTQAYDGTTGVLYGLSNNSSSTPNLATIGFNPQALPGSINYQTSSGGQLAVQQLGYDGDLRVQSLATTWLGGSGNPSGTTIFSQSLTYDPASNLTSLSTNQAPIPGNNNSGGTETQVFCYNEQNQLVWSGNTGTPPCSGNGNPGTPTGSIAPYTNTFVYTHLGQLWQGPLNGGSTQYQYLYCSSSAPHQLTGLYALGSTCSNSSGQGYATSYDPWGNVTGRTYSSTTAALSYDHLNRFVEWNAGSTNHEWYAYDAAGNRVLKRSTNSSGTTYTVYPFGLQEHLYSASGSNLSNTYYYFLGGQLLGDLTANGTYFLLTDALGSVLSEISWAAGGASVQANQLFGPYGTVRYNPGTFNTAKGFTGQYNDQLTGLDYFHARYYDPVVGVFLSADSVQGNLAGLNPYGYVGGNPETYADPTGQMYVPDPNNNQGSGKQWQHLLNSYAPPSGPQNSCLGVSQIDCMAGAWHAQQQLQGTITLHVPLPDDSGVLCSGRLSIGMGPGDIGIGVGGCAGGGDGGSIQVTLPINTTASSIIEGCLTPVCAGDPADEGDRPAEGEAAGDAAPAADEGLAAGEGPCSFTASTPVATVQGEQAIGTIRPGEEVEAYNPQTHQMELKPVLHVWINHDHDLVDLTLTTSVPARHGKPATRTSEVIHTNQKHPFLTKEKGFLPVGQIKLGMHILRADGTYGVVAGWKRVPGTQVMYNLEVAQDHTFTVGEGQWVVHNCTPGPSVARGNVPPTVSELADRTDAARAASGTQRMIPGVTRTPNFASIAVEAFDGDTWAAQVMGDFESVPGGAHAEEAAVEWAAERLEGGFAPQWGATKSYRVTLVTQYFPCPYRCGPAISNGSWQDMLDEAAGQSVSFEVWHYMDNGNFRLALP